VKKLISIGVALALLALVMLPVGVAAKDIVPSTYAKIPFAIVQSGFYLVGCLMGDFQTILTGMGVDLGFDLADFSGILFKVGDWAGVPLAWSVDMMIAGIGMVQHVLVALDCMEGLPPMLGCIADVLGSVVTDLHVCYDPTSGGCNNVSNVYSIVCP
jgi:hypothetical protein